MDIGPVELVVLTFPGERADPGVVESVKDVVSRGYVTVLDLVYLTRTQDGRLLTTDFDENLDATGLSPLDVHGQALLSEDDIDLVREVLEPGTSAALILYEETWARSVARATRAAGGEVALHVQLPRDTVEAAFAATPAA